jgi:ABC-type sugar transport system substrate-binding protein
MKKIVLMVLVFMMILGMVACGSNAPAQEEPAAPAQEEPAAPAQEEPAAPAEKDQPVIAFVPKVIGQAWWDYVRDGGVMKWAEENGIDVIYKGPTEVDAAAQVQIMTDRTTRMPARTSAKKLATRASS